ncbi:hypothetical protein KC19_4G239500 [Ceratodon purpureus]|uniref:Uncharacterized protein n=1 Tax=Ceratodon purpureus TaxID=3225 RepID=A0A8T0IC12_CERPU|nr:hypothetical protein KC19_4G239500 [Ceratodon purpureus]
MVKRAAGDHNLTQVELMGHSGNFQLMVLCKEHEATTPSQFLGKSSSPCFHCSNFLARIQKLLHQEPVTPLFGNIKFAWISQNVEVLLTQGAGMYVWASMVQL